MKSISALAIVSIIAILLAIGLVYIVVKPPSFLKTTTTSYITSYIPTTETSFIPTTYVFTTTYVYTTIYTTFSTYPTTITKTITETITYTYVPTEKIEVISSIFEESGVMRKDLFLFFSIQNKEYSSIYIDPSRMVRVEGEGLLINHPAPETAHWSLGFNYQRGPFTLTGSSYNPPTAEFCGTFLRNEYFDPEKIKFGGNYTVSFDYRVIYLNGTWSDWKTYTFNVILQKSSD